MKTNRTLNPKQFIATLVLLLTTISAEAQDSSSGDRHYRLNAAALAVGSLSGEFEQQLGDRFTTSVSGYFRPQLRKDIALFWEARGLNADVRYFPFGADRGNKKISPYLGLGMQWSYRFSLSLDFGNDESFATVHHRTAVGASPSIGFELPLNRVSMNVFVAPVFNFYENLGQYDDFYDYPTLNRQLLDGCRFGVFLGI